MARRQCIAQGLKPSSACIRSSLLGPFLAVNFILTWLCEDLDERQVVWPSYIVSMTVSTAGTFQSSKPVHFLKEQALQLAGLDCILQEIIKANLSKQAGTNRTVDGQKDIHSVCSIPKCSAVTAFCIEIENPPGEKEISSNENREESRSSPRPYGLGFLKPSVVVADYTAFSAKLTVESVYPDDQLPSVKRLAKRGGQGLGFGDDPMETKDGLKSPGQSHSTDLACRESSVSVPKTLRGALVIDSSRHLVDMKSGFSSTEDSGSTKERNSKQALVFDVVATDDKDRLQPGGPSESINLTGQEILMSRQKASRAVAGLGSGRHLVSMSSGPLSNGKVTDIGEMGCRQALVADHGSIYAKDGLHSPGPSPTANLTFHNCAASFPTSRATAGSSSGRDLVSMSSMSSSSAKVVDVGDFNRRQSKSSCNIDQCTEGREDIMLKTFHANQARSMAVATGSSACVAAIVETGRQSLVCEGLNLRGTHVLNGQSISTQELRDCSLGECLLSSPSADPEKQVREELTGDQREPVFHKLGVVGGLGNHNFEGSSGRSSKESLLKKELTKGDLRTDNEVHLIDLLEGLASLDENGIFTAAVENCFAPDHSKVIGNSLCFSVLREKIQSQGYKTWRSFVDDFEHMCYDAMNYNEKFSKVWNAANNLLHQGKKYLEQYGDKADTIFGLPTKIQEQKGGHDFDDDYCRRGRTTNHEVEHSHPKYSKEYQKAVHLLGTSDIHFLPIDDSLRNVSASTLSCTQNTACILEPEENKSNPEIVLDDIFEAEVQADESLVEILECVEEDIRFDPTEQATECSSSFGDTEFDIDNDSVCKISDATEVESELRNGNGAATALRDRKRKKALTLEWKDYRRCIEWRCRWLELRIKELESQASKYDRILGEIQAKKPWKNAQHSRNNFMARSTPLIDHIQRNRVFQRKQRKKVENMVELSSYMSRHPLFSLYEKKKSLEAEGISVDDESDSMQALTGEVNNSWLDENDFDDHLTGPETKNGKNSVEQMLWHIEALQSRILKMKNQLSKILLKKSGKFSPKNISNSYLTVECSKNVLQSPALSPVDHTRICNAVGGGSKLQPGSNLSRQRNSDYDICNLVMPYNAGATYVEPARHEFIETPQWRLLDRDVILDQPERADSSDEVTDEETYIECHAVMEVKEKKHRDFPCSGKKLSQGEGSFGKGLPKGQTTGAIDNDVSPASGPESISSSVCLPFDLFVPKCKRKRMYCRSSIQRVEGMYASAAEHPCLSNSPQEHGVKENGMNDGVS